MKGTVQLSFPPGSRQQPLPLPVEQVPCESHSTPGWEPHMHAPQSTGHVAQSSSGLSQKVLPHTAPPPAPLDPHMQSCGQVMQSSVAISQMPLPQQQSAAHERQVSPPSQVPSPHDPPPLLEEEQIPQSAGQLIQSSEAMSQTKSPQQQSPGQLAQVSNMSQMLFPQLHEPQSFGQEVHVSVPVH